MVTCIFFLGLVLSVKSSELVFSGKEHTVALNETRLNAHDIFTVETLCVTCNNRKYVIKKLYTYLRFGDSSPIFGSCLMCGTYKLETLVDFETPRYTPNTHCTFMNTLHVVCGRGVVDEVG